MKVLSLFAGIGGFDIACEMAGMEVVGQVEIDLFCQKILTKHWPHVKRIDDIKNVRGDEFGTIDIIVGGVPCQPASVAGKRGGTEDNRWLWPEAIRIIKTVRPKWCVLENPAGILSLQGGVPFDNILSKLETDGYEVQAYNIPACAVGAPHQRKRVFIVAYSEGREPRKQEAGNGGQGVRGRSEELANTTGKRQCPGAIGEREIREEIRRAESDLRDTEHNGLSGEGSVESRMGGVPSRVPDGMDGNRWPIGNWPTPTNRDYKDGTAKSCQNVPVNALLGRAVHQWPAEPGEQYDWEPPRVAVGVKDRVSRLKALGNAVVPAQVYPILKAIIEMEGG